jgi:copper chaperone CopZ
LRARNLPIEEANQRGHGRPRITLSKESLSLGRIALGFSNASCAHCARIVTRSLQRNEGVLGVEVDAMGQRVLVDFDPRRVSVDSLRAQMEGAGYPTRLLG